MFEESEQHLIRLGDASIASPFTARRTSIESVLTVIRQGIYSLTHLLTYLLTYLLMQGRCTLVTTIQVYKILALNCLVSAYMMSFLYLKGLKQGDIQMTVTGVVMAGLFFFLSQAKPQLMLHKKNPPSSVFAPSVALSIIGTYSLTHSLTYLLTHSLVGQFIVHLVCLIATFTLCQHYMQSDDVYVSPDARFRPNLINSSIFILTSTMQVLTHLLTHPLTHSPTYSLTLLVE